MIRSTPPLNRQLWRWYLLLVIANELDLVYTYFGLGRGFFAEANPLVQPYLLTLWPIAQKILPLLGLAIGVMAVARSTDRRQERMLTVLQAVTAVYAVVAFMHVVNLLATLWRG
ncbi:MAG TPA: DUF5658 family protein [bacterium]